ncbi:2-amino-4-hydroxy-6-hydroxymethyldihydropteridine diphosphokinase [Leptolyngbya sp. FACHB-261]|uniref:2-amino-4-hydroxy-6- hydroxymethyldihydropteridine diphosphokinase n=1 Tax=Leptolyngbya sp. FACHB-261 TaxID=2692806 RepID=UPI0018F03635|nr:2-amino-4-hydroxy-6-hydroxymethyldihydropteridine diphosphokinase [Leptolyngbya sp. FACHB-261]
MAYDLTLNTPFALALGGNLGDSAAILKQALRALELTPGLSLLRVSDVYETVPVGPPQPDYLNCCALLDTTLEPLPLLQTLLAIEQQAGRVRLERNGPRTLDLDLLLYGSLVLETPELTVPHPRMHQRGFVLVPLADIAPDWVHPVLKQTVAQLATQIDRLGVSRRAPVC